MVLAQAVRRFQAPKSLQSKCNMFALVWLGFKLVEYLRSIDEASLQVWESRLGSYSQVLMVYTTLTLATGYHLFPSAVTKIGLAVTAYVVLTPTLLHFLHRRSPATGGEAELIASRFFWLEIPVEVYFCMCIVRYLDSRVKGTYVWAKLREGVTALGRPLALLIPTPGGLPSLGNWLHAAINIAWFTAPAHEFYKERLTRSFLGCDCMPGVQAALKSLTRGPMLISNACLNDFDGPPHGVCIRRCYRIVGI